MREDWKEIEYKEVITVVSGKSQRTVEDENGHFPIYGSGGVIGSASDYLCEPGTTIIGRKGTINSPIYVSEKFWNIDTAFGLYPNECLLSKFNYLFCQHFNFKKLDKSTAVPSLAKRDILKIQFPLPPLPEQRAIVTKIEELFSSLDNGITNLNKAQAQLKVYRQAVLKKAFEGELTKEWREKQTDLPSAQELLEQIKEERERYYEKHVEDWKAKIKEWEENGKEGKKPGKPKKLSDFLRIKEEEISDYPLLPKNSLYIKMGNLSDIVRGGSPRPAGDPRYYNGNIPFLKVADLTQANSKFVKTYKYSIKEAGLHKTRLLHPNTLVISNSGATLGVPKILAIKATANDGIAAFLGLQANVLDYLYHFWDSQTLQLRGINQGAGQPNLNTDLLKNYIIPYFSLVEQTQIVQEIEFRLSVCDKVEESIDIGLEKAETLKQSILKKAFKGALLSEDELAACRAEEDWESAAVLLERIKSDSKKK